MDSLRSNNKRKEMKKNILKELSLLKPKPGATVEQSIESLVKQAEFYTNFLLSSHENRRNNAKKKEKKRGHFDEELSEERHILDEEIQEEQNQLTRLSEQPSILKSGNLKHYQLVGLNWMINLYESGLSGILADDMGLGKTIQTISMIGFLRQFKNVKGPHLVIAPKITLGNWKNQFEKWLPESQVVKLIATKQERNEILSNIIIPGKFDVVITSFEGVRICLNYLMKIKWHYVVIDEAHKIKNEESKLSQLVRKLSNQNKLLLTGTPLQNNLHQLWSLLNFLLPEIFDSSEMFDNWFEENDEEQKKTEDEIEKKNVHMIGQLHKILRPFMLRRTKLQVEKTLPPKKEVHIFVGLTDVQLKVYKSILHKKSATQDDKKIYLNLLMQLRKVCNHPYLFEGVEEEGAPELGEHMIEASGKMIILDKLLKKLKHEGGHQVLIFSQMTMVMDIIEDYCNYREYQYCRIDGSTDMVSRDEQIQDFMKPDSDKFIFLLSTRAGGLGINLTAADTVIIYDSDWNPQMDLQAMDRAHRIGQKNMVNVYRLITQDTIQEKIIQRQQVKLKWDNLVIQQAKTSSQKNKALTKQEIKDMLQFGASITLKAQKGTIEDEHIDEILARGESKTNAMNKALEEKVQNQQQNLTDFSMNSINIFDFMMDGDKKKKEDQQAMDEVMARRYIEMDNDMRTRRQKLKNVNYQIDGKKEFFRSDKRMVLPEHHFYEEKELLIQLLQKEEEYNFYKGSDNPREGLTQEQTLLKNKLLDTGFKSWNKTDFNSFITASEKFSRNNLKEIAKFLGKDLDEVEEYHKVFWEKIDELSDKERIIKQIQSGEDKIANKKYNMLLLQWKASQCYQIDFNPQIYTKFKSKLFSIDADRFLAQCAYKFGIKNMTFIKEKIRTEPMFRFDHHFRSRSESELNKRLQSLYKLIEKQKDHIELGFDNEILRENKKKAKKNKQKEKKIDNDDKLSNSNDDSSNKETKKNPKAKQILLTEYNKSKQEHISIDDSDDEDVE